MTLRSERRSFEKEVLKSLAQSVKGSRWGKNKNALYCEHDGYYVEVFTSVFLNATQTTVRLSAKPMSLDVLYWEITDLSENKSEPLSFRTWGAFTCTGLPIVEESIADEALTADDLATLIVEWSDAQCDECLPRLATKEFSGAVAQHPNQIQRGAYAITYVTSLINEGDYGAARKAAAAYADGTMQSVSRHTHAGKDFHQVAVEWLDSAANAR